MGLTRDNTLAIIKISKHQYYYKPTSTRSGRKPSETTLRKVKKQKTEVPNQDVIEDIKTIQSDIDTDYGYRKMCAALMLMGYFINHKKVYRLMKQELLLKERYKKQDKTYAKYRIVTPSKPLELIEMDIKYVWIEQEKRYAFILNIIDTFTRHILYWSVDFQMKSTDVKIAWEQVIKEHLQPANMLNRKIDIEIRNDNGPQFGSKMIQDFFAENYLNQVFTHPYTPQENGHVESFHQILSSSISGTIFWNLEELRLRLTVFYEKYNNTRLHSSIANLPPRIFWDLWEEKLISRIELPKKRVKFKLKIPYQEVLSGNKNLREASCLDFERFKTEQNTSKEVNELKTLLQSSVQKSPSIASC